MKVKGVVLCGGEGKRLRPLTYYFQKTMIPIGRKQKPLLEYIIKLLKHHGVDDIVLLVGYKHEQIVNYFEDGSRFNVKIDYVVDDPKLKGTGGALLNAYLKGVFNNVKTLLIYYGDILSGINLKELLNKHWSWNSTATLAVATKYQVPVGVVEVDGDKVKSIVEKPWLNVYATIGILALEREALKVLDEICKGRESTDIMGDLLPELISRGYPVYAYKHEGFWYDVGTSEKYEKLDANVVDEIFKNIL